MGGILGGTWSNDASAIEPFKFSVEILDNGLRHCGIQLKKRLLSSFFLNNILDSAEVESLSKLPENGCMILANFTQKVFFGGGGYKFYLFYT